MKSRVVRNIGWNGLFLLLRSGASLAVVPLLLQGAGDSGFGIYSFFLAVVTVSALIQTGIDLTIARSVARFRGDGDLAQMQADLSFGYAFSALAGVAQAGVLFGLVRVPGVIDAGDRSLATGLAAVFAVSALLNSPLNVPLGILVGFERFLLRNTITLVPLLVGAVVAFLYRDEHDPRMVIAYALAMEATRFVMGGVGAVVANRLHAHGSSLPRPRLTGGDTVRFQLKQIGNQVADYLFYTTDRLILQGVIGAVAVAHYAVAERPNVLAQQIISAPLIALIPSLASAVASHDGGYINRVLVGGTKVYCCLTLPILIPLLVWAPELIELWVGPGYHDSGVVAQVFIACLVVAGPFKIYSHYRLAEGSIGIMTMTKLGYAPINAVASLLLCREIGMLGVVLPTAVFYCLVYPAIWTFSIIRRGERKTFLAGAGRPVLAGLATLASAFALHQAVPVQQPVLQLLLVGAATALGLVLFAVGGGGLKAGTALKNTEVAIVLPDDSTPKTAVPSAS